MWWISVLSSHLIDNPDHGSLGINAEQIMHYQLQLQFRALIIIDIHAGEEGTEQKFQLVHTDITSELSALITFESIRPKYSTSDDDDDDKVVTTTLSAAIALIVALEVRERIRLPGKTPGSERIRQNDGSVSTEPHRDSQVLRLYRT